MIPINALTVTILSLILLALVATTYLAVGYVMDYRRFKEPNALRSKILFNVNLQQRTDDIYNYLAWHMEDISRSQPITQGEYSVVCSMMVANSIEGMSRQDTSEMLRMINELARDMKNQTRQPYRKDNVVELTVKKDESTGDGAQVR